MPKDSYLLTMSADRGVSIERRNADVYLQGMDGYIDFERGDWREEMQDGWILLQKDAGRGPLLNSLS